MVITSSFFRFSGYHLCDLQHHVRQIQDFTLSAATKRNYHSIWNTYLKFCDFYTLQPFPASPSTITAFITLVSFSFKSHHTINNYLSALRHLHVFCPLDASAFDDIHVKLTQKGLKKSMIRIPHRKAPLTPSILLQFHALLNLRNSAHLALWSALLVGFFTFFHTANLVPQTFDSFSPQQALSRGSVNFNTSGAFLTVTKTKTQQAGDTALVVPVPRIPGSPLCPTTALKLLLRMVPAPDACPLFTFASTANQITCITAKSLNDGIKHLVSLISLDPLEFSGHSLRQGGATFAFKCSIPAELIKLQGDWRSDTYMLYLSLSLADRLVLTQVLAEHVQTL